MNPLFKFRYKNLYYYDKNYKVEKKQLYELAN